MIIKSICIIVLFIISFIISLPFFFNYLNLNLLNFMNHYFIDLFYYNAFKFIKKKKKNSIQLTFLETNTTANTFISI